MSDAMLLRAEVADALVSLQLRPDLVYVLPLTCDVEFMAKLFQRSIRWVYAEVKRGTFPIPHDTAGGHLLWKRQDVQAWLDRPAVLVPSKRKGRVA